MSTSALLLAVRTRGLRPSTSSSVSAVPLIVQRHQGHLHRCSPASGAGGAPAMRRSLATVAGPPFRVLFFGGDSVSEKTLRALQTASTQVVSSVEAAVIVPPRFRSTNALVAAANESSPAISSAASSNQRKRRRSGILLDVAPLPVLRFAQSRQLRAHFLREGWRQSDQSEAIPVGTPVAEMLYEVDGKTPRFDIGVVSSFGQLIPSHVLEAFPLGAINMHPSLLPKYRGAAPVAHTLLNGDTETGVSIVEVSRNRFDAGNILKQVTVPVPQDAQHDAFVEYLSQLGADMVVETLANLQASRAAGVSQEGPVILAPKIHRADGLVRWSQHKAIEVYRMWQAFGSSVGLHASFGTKVVRLREVCDPRTIQLAYSDTGASFQFGHVRYDKFQRLVFIRCANSVDPEPVWLGVSEVSVDGHVQSAEAFANGFRFRNSRIPTDEHRFGDLAS